MSFLTKKSVLVFQVKKFFDKFVDLARIIRKFLIKKNKIRIFGVYYLIN
ncbi:hypothetical protein RV04_GL000156 [Enterococcus hermanniensis]|uniref:Uncharacterized protein n=1 Tax=Enterococcus hermanniensis TaxID=249189 RepID=A0A1L8TRH6_9ENTE|nr:hypothetical protein RV04_GL000156 [Enterococcus hermanniensis]